jgi:hypothetical protein
VFPDPAGDPESLPAPPPEPPGRPDGTELPPGPPLPPPADVNVFISLPEISEMSFPVPTVTVYVNFGFKVAEPVLKPPPPPPPPTQLPPEPPPPITKNETVYGFLKLVNPNPFAELAPRVEFTGILKSP